MNRFEYFQARLDATCNPVEYMQAVKDAPGSIQIIDVRVGPPDAVRERIEGAINIPFPELPERLAELPKDKKIAVCGFSTWCNLCARACMLLLENGFDAVELIGGIAAWKELGLPLQ